MGILLYEIIERVFCFVKAEINQIPDLARRLTAGVSGQAELALVNNHLPG
jgi:hypothetical protein